MHLLCIVLGNSIVPLLESASCPKTCSVLPVLKVWWIVTLDVNHEDSCVCGFSLRDVVGGPAGVAVSILQLQLTEVQHRQGEMALVVRKV